MRAAYSAGAGQLWECSANLDCPDDDPAPGLDRDPDAGAPRYLEVALASVAAQAREAGAEMLVIDDAGPSPPRARSRSDSAPATSRTPDRSGSTSPATRAWRAPAASSWCSSTTTFAPARAGCERCSTRPRDHPDVDVFTGPIRPRLEGRRPRTCGREGPPITALDLGAEDTYTRYAWGANMAIRRSALDRVGPFDESLEHGGDEQEWQERLAAIAGPPSAGDHDMRVLYVARAGVDHRRAGADARLSALARGAHVRGRAARRFDARRGQQPSLARELITLAGCAGHVVRRRCPAGLTMVAHSTGRLREGMHERLLRGHAATPAEHRSDDLDAGKAAGNSHAVRAAEDFLSGESGTVGGLDALRRGLADEVVSASELLSGARLRLRLAARRDPPRRRVLVLGIERPEHSSLAKGVREELSRSRHDVELHTCPPDGAGKFENLNRLLVGPSARWSRLAARDRRRRRAAARVPRSLPLPVRALLAASSLSPPTELNSHAAWPQTRRQRGSVVRETRFVEIGPVTAFASATFGILLPFPDLHMGWGLDLHWSALAREHGWRCGVIDAVAIRHRVAPAGSAYSREEAIAEARAFLAERPYLSAREAQRTLTTHRSW